MATNLNKISRRKTRKIKLKNVYIGGDAPISVQTMTNTDTSDVKETLSQIKNIEKAGADLVRVSCPDEDSTKSLKEIIKHVDIPIIADINTTPSIATNKAAVRRKGLASSACVPGSAIYVHAIHQF